MHRLMKTVLVVDDEIDILAFLVELLDGEGYRALSASDGQAALEAIAGDTVDLIIADTMMPRLSGPDLVRHIRDRPDVRHIPVILMSAGGRPRLDGITVHAFLSKPFDLDTMLGLVEDAIDPR